MKPQGLAERFAMFSVLFLAGCLLSPANSHAEVCPYGWWPTITVDWSIGPDYYFPGTQGWSGGFGVKGTPDPPFPCSGVTVLGDECKVYIDDVLYSSCGGPLPFSFIWNWTPPFAEGPHYVTVNFTATGDYGIKKPYTFTQAYTADNTPPVITWDKPQNNISISTADLAIAGSVSDAASKIWVATLGLGVESGGCQLTWGSWMYCNSELYSSWQGEACDEDIGIPSGLAIHKDLREYIIFPSTFTDCKLSIGIGATDRVSNGNSMPNISFMIDQAPPVISISTWPGRDGPTFISSPAIAGLVTDSSEIKSIKLELFQKDRLGIETYWNGAEWVADSGTPVNLGIPPSTNTITWSYSGLTDTNTISGSHYKLTIYAADKFDHVGTVVQEFDYIIPPPTVYISTWPGQAFIPSPAIAGTASAFQKITGITLQISQTDWRSTITYWNGEDWVSDSSTITLNIPQGTNTINWSYDGLTSMNMISGSHYRLTVYAADTSDQVGTAEREFDYNACVAAADMVPLINTAQKFEVGDAVFRKKSGFILGGLLGRQHAGVYVVSASLYEGSSSTTFVQALKDKQSLIGIQNSDLRHYIVQASGLKAVVKGISFDEFVFNDPQTYWKGARKAKDVPMDANIRDRIAYNAAKQLGKPYKFFKNWAGGTGAEPVGFRCDGLVVYAYRQAGIVNLMPAGAKIEHWDAVSPNSLYNTYMAESIIEYPTTQGLTISDGGNEFNISLTPNDYSSGIDRVEYYLYGKGGNNIYKRELSRDDADSITAGIRASTCACNPGRNLVARLVDRAGNWGLYNYPRVELENSGGGISSGAMEGDLPPVMAPPYQVGYGNSDLMAGVPTITDDITPSSGLVLMYKIDSVFEEWDDDDKTAILRPGLTNAAFAASTGTHKLYMAAVDEGFNVVTAVQDFKVPGPAISLGPNSKKAVADAGTIFDNLTALVSISMNNGMPDALPSGYSHLANPLVKDVVIDGTYQGGFRILISYANSGVTPEQESYLQILHNGQNITIGLDKPNKLIAGYSTSASPFTVAVSNQLTPNTPLPDIWPPFTNIELNGGKYIDSEGALFISTLTYIRLHAEDDRAGTINKYYTPGMTDSLFETGLRPDSLGQFIHYISSFTIGEGIRWTGYGSMDAAGNYEMLKTTTYYVDGTAPSTQIMAAGAPLPPGVPAYIAVTDSITIHTADTISNGVVSGLATTYLLINISPAECQAGAQGGGFNGIGDCNNPYYSGPFTLPVGEHTIYYTASDKVGNQSAVKTALITVTSPDIIPPVTAISFSAPPYMEGGQVIISTAVLIYLNALDPDVTGQITSGVATTYYLVDVESTPDCFQTVYDSAAAAGTCVNPVYKTPFTLDEGTHTVHYFSADKAGNYESVISTGIFIDGTPPLTQLAAGTMLIESGGTAYITSADSITLTASDLVFGGVASGVKATRYRLEGPGYGGQEQAYTGLFSLAVGTYTLYYYSKDNVANAEPVKTAGLTVLEPLGGFMLAGSVAPSSGPIGSLFTISGAGFGQYASTAAHVLLGGTAVHISSWTDAQIKGRVPGALGPGDYALTVERVDNGTTTVSNVLGFRVVLPELAGVSPSSGPIGTVFTITGPGFGARDGANTRVLLNGATVHINSWLDARIKAVVPAAAAPGAYPLVVERSWQGTTVSTGSMFTVVPPAAQQITPSSGPIGAPFTIYGSGFGPRDNALNAAGLANTRILIGGTTAPITSWTDARVKGWIPGALAARTYPAVLERETADGGLVTSSAGEFRVVAPSASGITPSSGPIAAVFTITGVNFGPYGGTYTRVLIGGATAHLSLWTDTLIKGAVPGNLSDGAQPVVVERLSRDAGAVRTEPLYFTMVTPRTDSISPSSGPIGSLFAITGVNLDSYGGKRTMVLLNGTTAQTASWTDTQVRARVPALAPGHAALTVRREDYDGGYAESAPLDFEIILPAASAVTPSSGPIGSLFTLAGPGLGTRDTAVNAAGLANTRLLLGGTTAQISSWTDSAAKGKVPGTLAPGAYTLYAEREYNGMIVKTPQLAFKIIVPEFYALAPSSGPIGAAFIISGAGFGNRDDALTNVLIGGTPAPITGWTDRTIHCAVPGTLAPGNYPLTVERRTADGGLARVPASTFTVRLPVVASVAPSSGPIGVPFNILGSGFGNRAAGLTSVLLNGTTIPVLSWTDSRIRASVPGSFQPGVYPLAMERKAADGNLVSASAGAFTVVLPSIASVAPSSAPAGAPFTIYGAGFGNKVASGVFVLVGGVSAPVISWIDAKVRARLPFLAAGEYSVGLRREIYDAATVSTGVVTAQGGVINVVSPVITRINPASGGAGAAFSVYGANFGAYDSGLVNGTPACRLTLGGLPCAISRWHNTRADGVVPDGVAYGTQTVRLERTASDGAGGIGTILSNGVDFYVPGGGQGQSGSGAHSAALTIMPEGGSVISPGRSAVTLPDGALEDETDITINPDEPSAAENARRENALRRGKLAAAGDAVNFGPDGLLFNGEAGLALPYDPAKLPPGKTAGDLAVYWWNDAASVWVRLESEPEILCATCAVAGRLPRLKAKTGHFSVYQALVAGIESTSAEFRAGEHYVFPNPAKGNNPTFHFECGIGDRASVTVYDISGHKIYEADLTGGLTTISGRYAYRHTWNAANIASGVYIYVFRASRTGSGDILRKGKLAIIR